MVAKTEPSAQAAITDLGIGALHDAYRHRRLDPVEVVGACLDRVAAIDPELRSFITVARGYALADAQRSGARWRAGNPIGPLDGIPIALKDNIDVAGLPCTAGTAAYRHRVPVADATVRTRLAAAGALLLGKLNMHEAALGATTDNPVYGRCINPLREGYTPGGSSGGSAAAVAAGLCVVAIGTDTMGSVRVPASYCGIYGYKPTTGAVPGDGIVPLSATLDAPGPLARSAVDAAIAANVLLGADSAPAAGAPAGLAERAWPALRIGVLRELESVALDARVAADYQAFLAMLTAAGARLTAVDLPEWNPASSRRAGLLVSEAEGYAYWQAMLGDTLEGLSAPLAAMLRYPARAGAQKLDAAYAVIAAIRASCARVFGAVDLIVLPTTPQPSFAHTDSPPPDQADCTALASLMGAPALAIPVGTDRLPASVQLLAAPGADRLLLGLAGAIDRLGR